MTRKVWVIAIVLGLTLSAASPVASADAEGQVYWSSAAHACTPGTIALRNDAYSTWSNYVSWNGSHLDLLAFWCPVQPNTGETEPNTLFLTALDNTGTASDAYVDATLWKISRSTGAAAAVGGTAGTDSTSQTGVKQVTAPLGESLDFETYYYYVRVEMDRDDTGDDARFYGVALDYVVP